MVAARAPRLDRSSTDGWARTAADLVAPGSCLYLVEFHLVTEMFGEDGRTVRHDYFASTGLRVEFLHEHDFSLFRRFMELEEDARRYTFPSGAARTPLLYSLRASKPTVSAS
jgi:hypothetical protein